MKFNKLIIVLLTAATMMGCKTSKDIYMFSYFKNNGQDGLHLAYSLDGLKWTALKNDSSFLRPQISKDKLMRDPCIIKGNDGKFHMVWTVSWTARGIGYSSSIDLVHWSDQQYIPVMEYEKDARNSWAPELFYDELTRSYLVYWATTIPGRFSAGDSSSESSYNHRIYYTKTKDFKDFSPTKVLYDMDFSVIDATIGKIGNKYFMVIKDETRFPEPKKFLCIAQSDLPTGPWSKPGKPVSPEGVWVEGPSVTKIGSDYYIYFDKYRDHKMGAVKSKDFINWEDISDKVSFPDGTRHGTVFKVSSKILEKLIKVVE